MISFSALLVWAVFVQQTTERPPDIGAQKQLGIDLSQYAPALEVFARQYTPDGRSVGTAGDNGLDVASGYVWSDDILCSLGASDAAPSGKPAFGWRYVVRVVSRSETELNVQFEYSRLWGDGNGASGRSRLRLNEPVELDRVTLSALGPCQAATLRLEMSMVMRPPGGRLILGPGSSGAGAGASGGGTGGSGRGGATTGGRGGGGGGGAGAIRGLGGTGVQTSVTGTSPAPQTDRDVMRLKMEELAEAIRVAGSQAGSQNVSAGRFRALIEEARELASRPVFDAEVWLVQKMPAGGEVVQRRQVSFSIATPFSFEPVVTGAVTIQVSGVLRMNPTAVSPLTVEIRRRIKSDGPPKVDNEGGSFQTMAIPKPDDVLSFELPPSREAGRTVPVAPEFSLRLRLVQK